MDSFHLKKEYIPLIIGVLVVAIMLAVYYTDTFRRFGGAPGELTEQQKLDILKELERSSPPAPSISDRRKILNDLSKTSVAPEEGELSEEGKLQILRALEKQTSSQ